MPGSDESERGDPPSRRRRGPPSPVLSVMLGAIAVVGTNVAADNQVGARAMDAIGWALLLLGPAALLLRRRLPFLVMAVTLAGAAAFLAGGYPRGPFFLAALVALFGGARRLTVGIVWGTTLLAYIGYLVAAIRLDTASLGLSVTVFVWAAVAVALASANRVRAEHFAEVGRSMAQARRAAKEAERAEQEQARRQAADERLRIAQELHDVLGHHLSLINVRAGVALHLLDSQPEQAREALGAIKQASSEALREVRGVLAALRPSDESAPRSPAPGLDHVEELGDELPLTVRREGPARALPPEVDRAAFRIVQESLTNVRRHAGPGASVTVTIRYADGAVVLLVDDTGNGRTDSTSDGNGIPGMRERATALGGSLRAGPRPGGGFQVEATLPTPPPTAPDLEVPR